MRGRVILLGLVVTCFGLIVLTSYCPRRDVCHQGFLLANDSFILGIIGDLKTDMGVKSPVSVRVITGVEERLIDFGAHISQDRAGAVFICTSQVLFQKFSPWELKCLWAHELGHYCAGHLEYTWSNIFADRVHQQAQADAWATQIVGRRDLENCLRHVLVVSNEQWVEILLTDRMGRADRVGLELQKSKNITAKP